MRIVAGIVLTLAVAAAALGQSREQNGLPAHRRAAAPVDEIIVQWRPGSSTASQKQTGVRAAKLATATGRAMEFKQQISPATDVLKFDGPLAGEELERALATIAADPDVEYAVPNKRRWANAIPSDPLFVQQWYFRSAEPAATRAEQAWDMTTGSNTTVVAVLDTGVRFDHEDLRPADQGGKLLPGYDFISNVATANDGNGRDTDPSDPGDWMTETEAQQPPFAGNDCIPPALNHVDSSWHGTRVASLIGAITSNATGIAGSSWATLLLPVRVLGKCGGLDSDIISAMRWAAGLTVPGVPVNPTPAKIINLSLGGEGSCSAAYQAAVNEVIVRGALIVVSVGNEGGPINAPANCSGVVGVTGLRHAGTKVGFSNLGAAADIGAPAGNCVNSGAGQPCLFSITAATNTGTTTPATNTYTDQFNFNVGTSFSAPLVAGAAALMHSVNDRLSPAQYLSLLRETANPFPTSSATTASVCQVPTAAVQDQECICTTQTCGAGMLNTEAAVLAAQRPFAIAQAPATISTNTSITIDARTSFASNNRTISSYAWSAVGVSGTAPVFADTSQPLTTFQVTAASQFTLRLTVTDDQGGQDTSDIAISTSTIPPANQAPNVPPAAVPRTGGGGGGGGGMNVMMLALAAFGALVRRRR